jgi:hypothetical protein
MPKSGKYLSLTKKKKIMDSFIATDYEIVDVSKNFFLKKVKDEE